MEKGTKVIVRTYSAGVHYGDYAGHTGKECTLLNTRRIYRWQGALSLTDIAADGLSVESKISAVSPEIILTGAIEIIKVTANAQDVIDGVKAWKT